MFQRHVSRIEMVIRRPMRFLKAGVLFIHLHVTFKHPTEIELGEDAVMRHPMVQGMGLEVMQVGETSRVRVTQKERHEGVSIVDGVKLLPFQVVLQVVFDHGTLMDGCCLCPSRVGIDTVAESEYVFESLVLQSVGVNIHKALFIGDASINQFLVWLARRVDNG